MWVITVLSLIGVVLNIKKRKECFLIWLFTNTVWMIYDFRIGAVEQGFLFMIYTGLAIWGIFEWYKEIAPIKIEDKRPPAMNCKHM